MKHIWVPSRTRDVAVAAAAAAFDVFIYVLTRGRYPDDVLAVSVLVLGLSAAALTVRRRFPIAVAITLALALLVGTWLPAVQIFAMALVALFAVAATLRASGSVAVLVGMAGAAAISMARRDNQDPWFVIIVYTVVFVVVWGAGRWRRRVADREKELIEDREQRAADAAREERLRLARELHDIVSHTVNIMTLQAAGARAVMDRQPEQVGRSLDVIEHAGVQAMNELHRLLGVLRSDSEAATDLSVQPQLSDIPQLIEVARASGQRVELDLIGPPGELDPSVELACFRVVQEGLTNARKYAGPDAMVRVNLQWAAPRLLVTVANEPGRLERDDRMAALSTGHGLAGLTERVQLVGGELAAGATEDGGYEVQARLPVASMRVADEAGSLAAPESDRDHGASAG